LSTNNIIKISLTKPSKNLFPHALPALGAISTLEGRGVAGPQMTS